MAEWIDSKSLPDWVKYDIYLHTDRLWCLCSKWRRTDDHNDEDHPFCTQNRLQPPRLKMCKREIGSFVITVCLFLSNQCNWVSGTFAFTIGMIPFRSYDETESTGFTIMPLPIDNRIAHRCLCARWIIIEPSLLFVSIWFNSIV